MQKKKNLAEDIYESLKNRILRNILRPGEMISEAYIEDQFHVSRTPARQALQKLQEKGLVEIRDGVGTFVTVITYEDMNTAYELRCAVEKLAAKTASASELSPEATQPQPIPPRGVLEDVSRSQPSLMRAQEVSRKTVACGFEWETVDDVWAKVDEEIAEFKAAVTEFGDRSTEAQLEFGDVLFALVNIARKHHIDAETALRKTNDKFTRRWEAMERAAFMQGKSIEDYATAELEELWQAAKHDVG